MLAAAAAASVAGAGPLAGPPVNPASGIELGLRTPFDDPPDAGACTVEVTIRNGSRRDGRWDLALGAHTGYGWTHMTRQSVVVEAGGSRTFLLVGLVGSHSYRSIDLTVDGPGIEPHPVAACPPDPRGGGRSGNPLQFSRPLALSRSVLGSGGSANLAKESLQAQGRMLVLSPFVPADLPADARSYCGFSIVLLRQDEWAGLRADVREALDDWVALGGQLWLLGPPASEARRGFGRITTSPLVGQGDADWTRITEEAFAGASWEMATDTDYVPWALPGRLTSPGIPKGTLFLLLLASSVLIGPLNLYWFARGRLRHRVYWTTPLVAALSAVALLALILTRDGTGGTGHRWTAIAILPDSHRAAVVQEQVARTGLLLRGEFQSTDPLRVRPILMEYNWRLGIRSGVQIEEVGHAHSGWFASRRMQAQYVETLRPTRARVQVRRGQSMEALSSIDPVLTRLFVIADDGTAWEAADVRAGVPAALRRSEGYDAWLEDALGGAGPSGRERLTGLARRRGYFYATAATPQGAIETLPSIRWTQDRLIYVGPLEEVR